MGKMQDNELQVKKAKIRRKKGGEDKFYFTSETQEFIVAYQQADDKKTKDRLYVDGIMPAFEKLVENLINIHSFAGLHMTAEDLKNDCVNFLFESLRKFDPGRGTNAFSYFNVVAKNWLIIKTKQKNQMTKRCVSISDQAALSHNEQKIIEGHNIVPSQDFLLESLSTGEDILEMLYQIRGMLKSENELLCVNSIITIFDNIEEIDLLNKSAILLYMRELSGLSPKQLTTAMQSIRTHYRSLKQDSLRDDYE